MGNRNVYSATDTVARKASLGPVRLNQMHANIRALDDLLRMEHFAGGKHNALEVPWVLGHVEGTTGYLFDTAYGGSTITNPATGSYAVSAVSGVYTRPSVAALVNVADIAIESKPHLVTWYAASDTSIEVRIRELSSALGAGNTWASVNRNFDLAVHAPAQPADVSVLTAHTLKSRRDFLTQAATDWNALVGNQATTQAAATLEHTAGGTHNVNRIAKAVWWGRPSAGPSFTTTYEDGVASILYGSTGVVTVTTDETFASTSKMACFVEAQPSTADEIVVVNGRGFSTTKFRFYTYAYSGGNWSRVDRPLFATMFGER